MLAETIPAEKMSSHGHPGCMVGIQKDRAAAEYVIGRSGLWRLAHTSRFFCTEFVGGLSFVGRALDVGVEFLDGVFQTCYPCCVIIVFLAWHHATIRRAESIGKMSCGRHVHVGSTVVYTARTPFIRMQKSVELVAAILFGILGPPARRPHRRVSQHMVGDTGRAHARGLVPPH